MTTPEFISIAAGSAAGVLLIAIAMRFPEPSPFQLRTLAVAVALIAATLATGLPGVLRVEILGAQAHGPLAVLVLVVALYGVRVKMGRHH
jgi:hypothetical protein